MFNIIALYNFLPLEDLTSLKTRLVQLCDRQSVVGGLIIAKEGINGTIAVEENRLEYVLQFFESEKLLIGMSLKKSSSRECPFHRIRISIKKEIVTLGADNLNMEQRGTYIEPERWNSIISDPDVYVLDTRNDYEISLGTFENAVDPRTTSFREFPAFVEQFMDPVVHKKIAMFCTGKSLSILQTLM